MINPIYYKANSIGVSFCNQSKYLKKQQSDIDKYGKKVFDENMPNEITKTITPYKRLSNKPCTLSEPEWFIKDFEKTKGFNFLPKNWHKMSQQEKVDYIVKDRYIQLVSNKIMNKIKNEKEENLYYLNDDGDIIGYFKGDNFKCEGINDTASISVHNHPIPIHVYSTAPEIEYLKKNHPEFLTEEYPFSNNDLIYGIVKNERAAYVVDSNGNKFLFENGTILKSQCNEAKEEIITMLDFVFEELDKATKLGEEKLVQLDKLFKSFVSSVDGLKPEEILNSKLFKDFVINKAKLLVNPNHARSDFIQEFAKSVFARYRKIAL
ncbi:MAG: hypothetical protein MJ231_00375 [bacterium]|nr:hypothetical protein [bacterium]